MFVYVGIFLEDGRKLIIMFVFKKKIWIVKEVRFIFYCMFIVLF